MKKVEKVVYEAVDGKIFENEGDCLSYESTLKNIKFVKVKAGSDLTEGRYSCKDTYYIVDASCSGDNLSKAAVNIICTQVFGKQYDFVMGVMNITNALQVWCPVDYESDVTFPINVIGCISESGNVACSRDAREFYTISEVIEYLNEYY